ncbi:MAG: 4Fe-4S dicluster domain-containing protein [Desulfovibrio sp.]|nr:4Fe-4S dicluster domain-containing protein [Desulfovibrio sp.]
MDCKRRKFLQIAAGTLVVGAGLAGAAQAGGELLRPPGAITEPDFLARCQRCMRCVDACQPAALTVAHLFDGLRNVGTPVLHIDKCIQCMDCVRACPSGALSKVSKKDLRMGVAVINESACVTYLKTRRCKTCVDACREFKAITLKDRRYPVVNAEKCTGCGACLRRCPERAKGAISMDASKVKRFTAPAEHFLTRLESRTEEVPPVPFSEWFSKRLETLAQVYGVKK